MARRSFDLALTTTILWLLLRRVLLRIRSLGLLDERHLTVVFAFYLGLLGLCVECRLVVETVEQTAEKRGITQDLETCSFSV